jgi:hypothetical protein
VVNKTRNAGTYVHQISGQDLETAGPDACPFLDGGNRLFLLCIPLQQPQRPAHTDGQAPHAVLQLSALLRYMLYECNEPVADVRKEIEVLQTYIALEKFRFGERLEISTSYTGDIDKQQIAPLLLLPFVENAVKHGTGKELDKCWMSLHLHVEKDMLTFKLINSAGTANPADGGGLGLQNVRRRLNLLYPGHQLKITHAGDTFMVSLTLGLSGGKEAEPFHSLRNDYYETEMPVGR